jgi:tRNA threonylcarbamoyl adenosine modification protein YjeE
MYFYQIEITTCSDAETRYLGQKIGVLLSQGLTVALTGDLGSGKTCLVQGLAEGLNVPDHYPVTSPSYTLMNEYPGRLTLYHVDLYRIDDPSDCDDIGLYDILDGDAVSPLSGPTGVPPVSWLSIWRSKETSWMTPASIYFDRLWTAGGDLIKKA